MVVLKLIVSILVTVFVTENAADTANYCDPKLCGGSSSNIGCQNSGAFPSNCPAGTQLENLDPYIPQILNYHNSKRNLIASGNANFAPACKMATMQWDNELAYLAGLNLKKYGCSKQMVHDTCHNTDTFLYSGQNLANMNWSGTNYATDYLLNVLMDLWFNENKVTSQSQINSYPNNYSGPQIGHFTVMVADKNTRVGCAALRLIEGSSSYFYYACNYATTNMIGRPIYASCASPALGCSEKNPLLPNLCSVNQYYDVNKW